MANPLDSGAKHFAGRGCNCHCENFPESNPYRPVASLENPTAHDCKA